MKVASFTIDHDRLLRGIYVSRKDSVGNETVTTFDVRIKRPNIEPPVDIPAIHTLEHLLAVYLDKQGKYHYFSPYCPHLKCLLMFDEKHQIWHCPCHQSIFDCYGKLIEGPSLKNMKKRK